MKTQDKKITVYHLFNTKQKLKAYPMPTFKRSTIQRNTSKDGEMLETKIERIVTTKEPIKDGAPIVYTERKDGVKPAYDIRTDRWEIAIEATDKIAKSYKARREEAAKPDKDGKPESIQGKDETTTETPK